MSNIFLKNLSTAHVIQPAAVPVTSTLIVPTTRRRTLGDRAFPVAAARAWNSLPSFVRDQQSLAAFRHQLKTVLFRTSFGEDANA